MLPRALSLARVSKPTTRSIGKTQQERALAASKVLTLETCPGASEMQNGTCQWGSAWSSHLQHLPRILRHMLYALTPLS